MKTETRSKILKIIEQKGKVRPATLVELLKISPQAIHRHLRALTQQGAVGPNGSPPFTEYSLKKIHESEMDNYAADVGIKMRVKVKKFGEILTSRPAGREAGLSMRAYFKAKPKERIELDFNGVLAMGPSWLDEVLKVLEGEYGKGRIVCLPSENLSVVESL